MKCLPAYMFHIRVVEVIADQGIAQIFHVDAYLMRAPGLEAEGYEAVSVLVFYKPVVCDGMFSPGKVHGPLDDRTGLSGQRCSDRTFFRSYSPSCDCQVFPVHLTAAGHGGEDAAADKVFGNDGKAGGVPVEAVAAAEDKRLFLPAVIPCQAVGQRVRIVVHGRVNRHSGRFVHDNDIFIFIYDIKRDFDRRYLFRALGLLDAYCQKVPR